MSILESFNLNGKTALVTGCKRGIGKAMALALAEAGADIIGVSASLKADDDIVTEVAALGRSFTAHACDFSDRQALYRFIEKVNTANAVPIDILVNNAGTVFRKPAHEHADEHWDKVMDVNLNAQFILSREIAKGMLTRGKGKLIFTASLLSFQGGIMVPSYASSKHAIAGLTKALANEWADKGIQVNAIAPGYIETDITEAVHTDPVRHKAILDRIPTGKWGHIDDLKGPTVFLASSASDYVTGEVLVVDGGWMAR